MSGVEIRTETKRTAFVSGPALQVILKASLGVPDGSGLWIRPEVSSDETFLLSIEVEWIERGDTMKLSPEKPA